MTCETIDAAELARRWGKTRRWVMEQSRLNFTEDPIPHVRLGDTIWYEWGCQALQGWWDRKRCCDNARTRRNA